MEQETFVNLNVKNLSEQVKVTIPEQTISAQINQSKITIPFQIKIEQSSSERDTSNSLYESDFENPSTSYKSEPANFSGCNFAVNQAAYNIFSITHLGELQQNYLSRTIGSFNVLSKSNLDDYMQSNLNSGVTHNSSIFDHFSSKQIFGEGPLYSDLIQKQKEAHRKLFDFSIPHGTKIRDPVKAVKTLFTIRYGENNATPKPLNSPNHSTSDSPGSSKENNEEQTSEFLNANQATTLFENVPEFKESLLNHLFKEQEEEEQQITPDIGNVDSANSKLDEIMCSTLEEYFDAEDCVSDSTNTEVGSTIDEWTLVSNTTDIVNKIDTIILSENPKRSQLESSSSPSSSSKTTTNEQGPDVIKEEEKLEEDEIESLLRAIKNIHSKFKIQEGDTNEVLILFDEIIDICKDLKKRTLNKEDLQTNQDILNEITQKLEKMRSLKTSNSVKQMNAQLNSSLANEEILERPLPIIDEEIIKGEIEEKANLPKITFSYSQPPDADVYNPRDNSLKTPLNLNVDPSEENSFSENLLQRTSIALEQLDQEENIQHSKSSNSVSSKQMEQNTQELESTVSLKQTTSDLREQFNVLEEIKKPESLTSSNHQLNSKKQENLEDSGFGSGLGSLEKRSSSVQSAQPEISELLQNIQNESTISDLENVFNQLYSSVAKLEEEQSAVSEEESIVVNSESSADDPMKARILKSIEKPPSHLSVIKEASEYSVRSFQKESSSGILTELTSPYQSNDSTELLTEYTEESSSRSLKPKTLQQTDSSLKNLEIQQLFDDLESPVGIEQEINVSFPHEFNQNMRKNEHHKIRKTVSLSIGQLQYIAHTVANTIKDDLRKSMPATSQPASEAIEKRISEIKQDLKEMKEAIKKEWENVSDYETLDQNDKPETIIETTEYHVSPILDPNHILAHHENEQRVKESLKKNKETEKKQ